VLRTWWAGSAILKRVCPVLAADAVKKKSIMDVKAKEDMSIR